MRRDDGEIQASSFYNFPIYVLLVLRCSCQHRLQPMTHIDISIATYFSCRWTNGLENKNRQYHQFFLHNMRQLEQDYSKLFPLALACKLSGVRTDCSDILANIKEMVESMHAHLSNEELAAEGRSPMQAQNRDKSSSSMHEVTTLLPCAVPILYPCMSALTVPSARFSNRCRSWLKFSTSG